MIESAADYGRRIRNNAADVIAQVTGYKGDPPRKLDSTVTAGVLVAQSNLAIAASLAELADAIRGRS